MKSIIRNGLLALLGFVSMQVVQAAQSTIYIHNMSTVPLWLCAEFSKNCSNDDYRTDRYKDPIARGGVVAVPATAGCTLQAIHFNPTRPNSDEFDYQGYTTIGMPVGSTDVHFYVHTIMPTAENRERPDRPHFFVNLTP